MKLFKFTVLIIGFIIKSALSLKSSELCNNIPKDCRDQVNSSFPLSNCVQKCFGHFSYQCSVEYCTESEHSCKIFLKLKQEIRSLNTLRSRMGIEKMFEKKLERNNKFIKSVKKCGRYEWKATDTCLKTKINCRVMQKMPLVGRLGGFEYMKTIECQCKGVYSFNCGKEYCTRDQTSCNGFNMMKNSAFISSSYIKKCVNMSF